MALIILASISCFCSLIAISLLAIRKNKRNTIAIVFAIIGIVTGFVALAVSAPRDLAQHGIDYLGLIVAILAIFATLLLGMQLYHVFRLKEDADEVQKAKDHIDGYTQKLEEFSKQTESLSETIELLKEKTKEIENDIKPLYDSVSDIQNQLERAVFVVQDGPSDDK